MNSGAKGPVVRRRPDGPAWREIRRLCCETGRSGKPIELERWPFFGEYWIGPYERFEPDWAYVLEEGQIAGYLTGSPDTARFERQKGIHELPLFGKAVLSGFFGWPYSRTPDLARFIRRKLGIDPSPELLFPRGFAAKLYADYPAHLHINLDSRFRGRSLGAKLIEAYIGDLKREGVKGVHLFCGPGPVPFYLRCGFKKLSETRTAAGAEVFALGRSIRPDWKRPL